MANGITLFRVLLAILVVVFLQQAWFFNGWIIVLIPVVMLLDIADGWAARRQQTVSAEGALLDILADRIIEALFFIYFVSAYVCPAWVALVVVIRGLIVDAIRSLALREGKTAFGASSLHRSRWAAQLVTSRWSRGLYNTLKTILFVLFAMLVFWQQHGWPWFDVLEWLPVVDSVLLLTVALSILRALPVIYEGWRYCRVDGQ